LRKLFHDSDRLLIVKYVSQCGCIHLKPILNKVDEFDGKIHFVEIDIEQDRDIAEQAGVAGTPTIQFKNKELLNQSKASSQRASIAN